MVKEDGLIYGCPHKAVRGMLLRGRERGPIFVAAADGLRVMAVKRVCRNRFAKIGLGMIKFDDATNEHLFGAEDAENENLERFKEYFFSNRTYENLIVDIPIRILVGHKGTGKSALLRRAYIDDEENSRLSVWIRPNDLISYIGNADKSEFNQLIEDWKLGLVSAITHKAISRITDNKDNDHYINAIKNSIKKGMGYVIESMKIALENMHSSLKDDIKRNVVKRFLQDCSINVYIDDIDRGWDASENSIRNISALLNAIRDLSGSDSRIKFRIGLRTDVYYLVRTSDESTDKIERHVIWFSWTNHEILSVITKRVLTFLDKECDQETILKMNHADISKNILSEIMVPNFGGSGHWSDRPIHNVLLSLTRRRPRDLIKLMHKAARNAYEHDSQIITTRDFEKAFEPYSQERLQDTINEFSSELPHIGNLLLGMRQTRKERETSVNFLYTTGRLVEKMKEIMSHSDLHYTNRRLVTPKSLIQFLYKIDFIIARKDKPSEIERRYFDQSRFLANEVADFGYDWEIHPAYRWALQPQDVVSILDSIQV